MGNKFDLYKKSSINKEEVSNYCKTHNTDYTFVSAKTGEGISIFLYIYNIRRSIFKSNTKIWFNKRGLLSRF